MLQSIFSRRARIAIDPGLTFRREAGPGFVETATVLERFADHDGIDHVRFSLHLSSISGGDTGDDVRVLATEAFAERYQELLEPTPQAA